MMTKAVTHQSVNWDLAADCGKSVCQANSERIVNAVTSNKRSQNFRGVIIQYSIAALLVQKINGSNPGTSYKNSRQQETKYKES
jgi:hypothetical protein